MSRRGGDAASIERDLRVMQRDVERVEKQLDSIAIQVSSQAKGLRMLVEELAALDRRIGEAEALRVTPGGASAPPA